MYSNNLRDTSEEGITKFEMNYLINVEEKNLLNLKSLQKIFEYDNRKEICKVSTRYSFQIYIAKIVLVIRAKIENNKKHLSNQLSSFSFSIIENLFLILKNESINNYQNSLEKFKFDMNELVKELCKYYIISTRNQKLNENFRNIITKEFIVLLQYLVSDDKSISDVSMIVINDYISNYPFLFQEKSVFETFKNLIDPLYDILISKFSSVAIYIQTSFHSQHVRYPNSKVF